MIGVLMDNRFDVAFVYATRIKDQNEILQFGKHALMNLEINYAIRIYRLCTSPDMVFALNSIKVFNKNC